MSAFAELLAQAREDSALLADWAEEATPMSSVDADNVRARILAALDLIEQRATEAEAKIADAEEWLGNETRRRQAAEQRAAEMEPRIVELVEGHDLERLSRERDEARRRATDMERWIDTVMAQGGPVTSDYAEGERLLAALSAREEQTRPTPADNRGASSPPPAREEQK